MSDLLPGQRCVSEAEPLMGLGTILSADARSVTVLFLATGETRTYAREGTPISRVTFSKGARIRSHEGWTLSVDEVHEEAGLLFYVGQRDDGESAVLPEGQIDNFMQLNRPGERLLAGQLDAGKWFNLRYQTLEQLNRLGHSELHGLGGVRTSLIPHQLYIAHEVANRFAPRVLLADEVGLGKTIEAGLILHHQLLTERAQRVLIVVPESLVHQWLVEMLRRFNLMFSLFDEARCEAIEESSGQGNPFETEQLVLCNLAFLTDNPERLEQAVAAGWDLLVVDEAHHLRWSAEVVGPEYLAVEQLASETRGVLLLTATPEQLGKAGHFARLRLLDPDRFPDYAAFVAEEQGYEPIAAAISALLAGSALDDKAYETLLATVVEGDNQALLALLRDDAAADEQREAARQGLIEHLLDRHGTSRVLFRNTRAAVKGFPERQLQCYPLPMPAAYAEALASATAEARLQPERCYQQAGANTEDWFSIDPRISWLADRLKSLRPDKVLVIAASADTALDIAEALRVNNGIHAPVFHEGMSIIERDRAAAFFADPEYGSQLLICSEIGSEGRNFQFAHHLILFDLPLNPDLLEQRIGRLDRIGQRETINIHVPYLQGGAQAIMQRWYHEGLNAFEHTCPAGHSVFVQVREQLLATLGAQESDPNALQTLIDQTHYLYSELTEQMHRGRDLLLEYNSCRPEIANQLRDHLESYDAESALPAYIETLFDCYGVDMEEDRETSLILRPGERMQMPIPGLDEDGMTVTFDRATALAYEDMQFLTWEHPLVSGTMEMVMSQELGNSTITTVKIRGIAAGTLLLEAIYILEGSGQSALQASRYLPPTSVRVLLDANGKEYGEALKADVISRAGKRLDVTTASRIIHAYNEELRTLLTQAEQHATRRSPAILSAAHAQTRHTLKREIDRLKALRKVNPAIRDEEIEFFEQQWQTLDALLDTAQPRLDAVRVIVTT